MFNQLFKIGLFVTLGLWLKHRLRGLACLLVVLLLTWIFHGEYLAYVERSGNTEYLLWSFIIKWLVIVTSFVLYYLLVEWRLATRQDLNKQQTISTADPVGDGFDFLRQKQQLDSKVDMIIKNPDRQHD